MNQIHPAQQKSSEVQEMVINRYTEAIVVLRSMTELERIKENFFKSTATVWHAGAYNLFCGLLRRYRNNTLDEILRLILKGHLQNIIGSDELFLTNYPHFLTIDQTTFNTFEITLFTCFENFLEARSKESEAEFCFADVLLVA